MDGARIVLVTVDGRLAESEGAKESYAGKCQIKKS